MKTLYAPTLKRVATLLTLGVLLTTFTTGSSLAFNAPLAENIAAQSTGWPPIPKLKKLIPKKLASSVVPLNEKNQKLADRLKAALDSFKPVDSYRKEVKVSELEVAAKHLKETSGIISTAKRCIGSMDYKARGHMKVKVLREKLKSARHYFEAANGNFRTVKKTEEERLKAKAEAEHREKRKYTEAARRFHQVYKGIHYVTHWANFKSAESTKNFKGSIGIYSESHITKAQALAQKALKACSTPSFVAADGESYQLADALVADKYCAKEDKGCSRIAEICEMAKPENLNSALTRAYIRTLNESTAVQVKKVEEMIEGVRRGNGFMKARDFMNTMRHLNGGKWAANANTELFVNELKRVQGYFKILGTNMPEGGPFTARNEANKRLGEEVEKNIKSWGRWPKDGKFKEARATKAVKRGLGKLEKAVKVGMWQKNWKINKNGLGITISRHKHGYVISKVKGNKYCQLAGFQYVERYIGGSKFQKQGSVGYDGLTKAVTCK